MIRFEHVSKQYSGTSRPALNAINLEVLRGEFVFLVGASGSGKSSCLRLILKEEKPTTGKIHVLGQDLGTISSRKVPYFRRNIGVVFQDFRLLPNKTVFENVAFTLQVIGKSRGFIQEAVPDVLKMVGLDGKAQRLPHELSGGEQQRVAIARAVVNKPQVLLADEPTGNLDPATSAGIMAVLDRINAGGTTVLMATHEAAIVDQMKRRVIELVNGQIIRDERHGGYGVTAAVPTLQAAPAPVDAQQASAPAQQPVYAQQQQPAYAPQQAAYEQQQPMTRPQVPTSDPAGPVSVPVPVQAAPQQTRPAPGESQQPAPVQQPGPAHPESVQQQPAPPAAAPAASAPEPAQQPSHYPAPVQFATAAQPVTQAPPPPPPASEDLPDHLNFTANLDLRGLRDDSDRDGEQNVGPTK
ncbi:cell division ATP-binding protein FtsE [Leifsonia sp. NPDC102414]|uniref:cell division ATP-binding protein FtsE n=1 Tax=Leifsonia sp. NPDC102414 TaxID=3364124 RepID=UPI00381721BA